MKKKIGIDLDNTIINYENSFKRYLKANKIKFNKTDKFKVKELIKKNKKIVSWTKTQEEIYGKYIIYAKKFKFYNLFENFALRNKFKLYIISHKTHYSEYSQKYDLHKVSNLWLKKNLKVKNYNIFFLNSIKAKLNKIKDINPNFYIDDLDKILKSKKLPKKIKKIYFSNKKLPGIANFDNWKEIREYIKKNEIIK